MNPQFFRKVMISAFLSILASGCASYQFGQAKRALPGGYDRIAIPIFVNKTPEVGIETFFTQSLITEFERSGLAHVTSKTDAQVILEGTISNTAFTGGSIMKSGPDYRSQITTPNPINGEPNPIPDRMQLSRIYDVLVQIHIVARKVSDSSELWHGDFSSQRQFTAPLIGTPGKSSANALYIESSRQDTVSRIAKELMSEAHDRLTENF